MKYRNPSGNCDSEEDDMVISSDDDQEYSNNLNMSENPSISEKSKFSSVIQKLFNFKNLSMRNNAPNLNDDMVSGDEDENSTIVEVLRNEPSSDQIEKSVQKWNNKTIFPQLKCLFIRIRWFAVRLFLNCLGMAKYIILLLFAEFVLLTTLIFKAFQGFTKSLTSRTNSTYHHIIKMKFIFTTANRLILFIKSFLFRTNTKVQKFRENDSDTNPIIFRENNNFNSSEINECIHSKYFICLLIGLCLIPVVLQCSFYYTSKISKVQATYQFLKTRLSKYSDFIFLLPGENCMRVGKCCKGLLEGAFRWSSCLGTTPIRLLLTIWHKCNVDAIEKRNGFNRIHYYLERIYDDIDQVKEDIDYQDESFFHIQTSIINLKQIVNEKANFLKTLNFKVEKLSEALEKFKRQVETSMTSLKNIINLKDDTDKMVDSITTDSEESVTQVKNSLSSIQNLNEAKQQRLITQIENLENLLKEDQTKTEEKNIKVIQRIETDITGIKNVHQEIRKRILSLFKIQTKFKEKLDNVKKEFRNKFHGEMVHHEQMSKRTEKMCISKAEKLNNDLIKAKRNLACFINKTIFEESNNMYIKLRKDISDTLHDQTVEMAQMAVEQALIKQTKTNMKIARNIKKCGIISYVFNYNVKDQICPKEDRLLVDIKALCKLGKSKDSAIEDQQLLDPVDKIIYDSLKIVFADDIGKADFALESSGGSIIIEKSTPPYTGRAAFLSLLGFTFGKIIKSIRKIIQPGNLPGECYAFQGDNGQVVIRLARTISMTAVTIDHTSRFLTPNGKITSAPKRFSVYALRGPMDEIKIKLGEFEYDQLGDPIQTFVLEKVSQKTNYVQFNFLTNHGNKEYTCIYRIRVHGVQINE